ncbi:MAG: hypothetical protein K2P81_05445 [Bacteriovoracaceae bacterium]|nr:hypothetical protein [Bacteriovoracaceae bacterium]
MKKILITALTLAAPFAFAETTFTPYGFIKVSGNYADKAVSSFNNVNMSAPTSAAPEDSSRLHSTSRSSFQAAQSRFGAVMKKSDKLSARLEFDLIDFTKSSPTTQMYPRVRRALVNYKKEDWSFDIGQDWDLFSPTTPYTYDIIGNYFNAGNSGFMRQQMQVHKQIGSWEISGALGMATSNPGTADSDLEIGKAPSYSVRILNSVNNYKYGVSGIYSNLQYTSNNSRHESFAGNAFFEHEVSTFGIKAELFAGQNLSNLGALTLAKGTATADLREWGGFLSAQAKLNEEWKMFGGVGIDQIDNKGSLSPYAVAGTGTLSSLGARKNGLTRLGVEHIIETDFSWITEISHFETSSMLAANSYKTTVANVLETGIMWKF